MRFYKKIQEHIPYCQILAINNEFTVNSKFFVTILFSQIALKDIFVTLKSHNWSMIYLHQ